MGGDGVAGHGGAVEVLEEKERRLRVLDAKRVRYREAALALQRAYEEQVEAARRVDALNQLRPRTVSDAEIAARMNALVPKGVKVMGRSLTTSLMGVRRMLGKAPPK